MIAALARPVPIPLNAVRVVLLACLALAVATFYWGLT